MQIEHMSRTQVIQELAPLTHPRDFHGLLTWSTAQLKALLQWYKEERA